MPYRIIVADSSPSVQRTVQLAFPEPEFRLYPFEDGLDLLKNAPAVQPDAVILSGSLAGRDGYEVGRILRGREDFKRVPLLFLKGTFEPLDTEKFLASDYDGVVQKPFDSEKLAAAVRELIEKKTSPSTLPEDPIWTGASGPGGSPMPLGDTAKPPRVSEETSPSSVPDSSHFGRTGFIDAGFRELVRKEVLATEREIEKRVRARVLAELKEWTAGEGRGTKETP